MIPYNLPLHKAFSIPVAANQAANLVDEANDITKEVRSEEWMTIRSPWDDEIPVDGSVVE